MLGEILYIYIVSLRVIAIQISEILFLGGFATSDNAQYLFLTVCSVITPGGDHGIICGAREELNLG